MLTLQPERTREPSDAHHLRSGGASRPRRAVRVLVAVAAFLAFGVLGLVVLAWKKRRGRRRPAFSCDCCRRRRNLTYGVTFVVAGLVLAGAGLSVNQYANGPDLPTCRPGPSAVVTGESHDLPSSETAGGPVWSKSRQVVTAPVSGLARQYVHDRGGDLCADQSTTIAFLPSAAADSGVAVGGVVLIAESPDKPGPWAALARHESRHVDQWATLTLAGGPLAMPVLYAVDDAFFPDSLNHFERAAGLEDGGYPHVDGIAPQPNWASAMVIGVIVVAVFRRRLRWVSRVLVGGRAAVADHQYRRCPLHSTGWSRVRHS